MYNSSSVRSSSSSRISGTAPPRVLALDFDGGDLYTSSTNHPQTEVYSTGPALQTHRNSVEDEEAARRKASPVSGIEAPSKSASPFTQPVVLSSAVAPESYPTQRSVPSHVAETSHSLNAARHHNGQANCGESPPATRARVLPPRLSLPWLAQPSANTPPHSYTPTISPYTTSPYIEHDPSFASVQAPNPTPYYSYHAHGHPLSQYPQHPLPPQHAHAHAHAHAQHKYLPYPPTPYYYGPGYYPPPPASAAYTTPTTTASSYSLSEGPSPISTSPEVQTHALSKRGSVVSLATSISGSSASGGGRSAISVDELVGGGGEHATPTPAAHVPTHGSAKALFLDMARAARSPTGPMMGTVSTPPNPNPVANPEKNAVDVAKIEAGVDTRTTVMLKVMFPTHYGDALETYAGGKYIECSQQDVQLRVAAVYLGRCS